MTEPKTLDAFVGPWRISRRIEDHRAGQILTGAGRVVFHPDGQGGLIHDEEVTLDLPGQGPITGTRRYLWQAERAGVQVLFADGKPFHRIAFGQATSADKHFCAPDQYDGAYDFAHWPVWEARWTVSGPRKDYRMLTRFQR